MCGCNRNSKLNQMSVRAKQIKAQQARIENLTPKVTEYKGKVYVKKTR